MMRVIFSMFLVWIMALPMRAQYIDLNYLTPDTYEILDITVSGNESLSKKDLVSISGLSKGDRVEIPGDEIRDAAKNIWKQNLVDDVRIEITDAKRGGVIININISEVPRLASTIINGHKGDPQFKNLSKAEKNDVYDLIPIAPGAKITESARRNTELVVKRFFKEKGFYSVTCTTELDSSNVFKDKYKNLLVDVDKGKKVKIDQIIFRGNRAIPDKKLKKKMKETKERKFYRIFSRSKYVATEFRNDKKAIIDYYNSLGYRDARIVGEPKVTQADADGKLINLEIEISEGSKYYFRNIAWTGNYIYSDKRLNDILQINKGDIYNKQLLDTRLNYNPVGPDVSSMYLDDGYLFFSVKPVEVSVEGDSIDIEMRVYEGAQATIKNVTVNGNTKTSDHVILREIRTLPGDKFNRSLLIRTQREISQLGYFDPEQIGIFPKPNPQDGTVDIEYNVVEKPSDQLQLSGGWGGIVGFVGTLGLVFNNFSLRNVPNFDTWSPLPAGDGQRLSVRFQANGPRFQTYSLSFTEPWLGGRKPNSFTVSLTRSVNNNLNANNEKVGFLRVSGVTLSLGKRLRKPDNFFVLNGTLSYLNYNIDNSFNSSLCETCRANNLTLGFTLSRDNRGINPNFYTSGSLVRLSVSAAPPYSLFKPDVVNLPSPEKYTWNEYHKWYFDNEWYLALTGNRKKQSSGFGLTDSKTRRPLVLQTRAHFGLLGAYNPKLGVGPFERFILGGDGLSGAGFSTFILGSDIIGLRGYRNNTITPVEQGGLLFNKFVFELRYPLVTEGVATIFVLSFLEGGNNWASFSDYDPFRLHRSAGFGVRIFMPAFGMIGVDYGKGFDAVPGCATCNEGQFHFTIGQQVR